MITGLLAFQLSDNQKGPMVIVIGIIVALWLMSLARKK